MSSGSKSTTKEHKLTFKILMRFSAKLFVRISLIVCCGYSRMIHKMKSGCTCFIRDED